MKIAILSGKGGTGKTLVSVNLAAKAKKSCYMDCDVEEPNGYLFFKPKDIQQEDISVRIPIVDRKKCNGCRKCVDFCKFNALAYINNKLIVFDDICHSCGGCILLCPQQALTEKEKNIGVIQSGISENVSVITGVLNVGEASGIPIIKKMMKYTLHDEKLTFIDCPPGSSCIVMESIKNADYCILVAEPTIFGVHNLSMVYELVKLFDKPHGVVLNKSQDEENPAEEFCKKNNIKILSKILFDKSLGMLNSNAQIVVKENIKYQKIFSNLLSTVAAEVQNETIINS